MEATSEAASATATAPDGPSRARPSRAECAALLAICGVALTLRLWNLQQLRAHDPFFELPSVDARMYHAWAIALADGDWLGDEVFLNGPLYPYLLGVIYALFGPSLAAAKLCQALLGTLSCALTWAVGRRLFSWPVALGGAAIVAVYEMLIFYEGTLVVANLLVVLGLVAIGGVVRALEHPSALRWLAAGAGVGLAAIARPNLALFGALCGVGLLTARRDAGELQRRAVWLAAFALGGILVVSPVTLRNYVVGGDFVPVTYAGGLNLFTGNNPDADGSFRVPRMFPRSAADDPWEQRAAYAAFAERAEGRALRPSEVSDFWTAQAWRFVREQPRAWMRVMGRKLELSVNAFEPWNIRSITLTRDFSAVLRLPLPGFAVLVSLAALGIACTARRWRELIPLYALLATVWGTMLVFFVLSRYRVPAVPVLALFASAGLVEGVARVRNRGLRVLTFPLIVALVFGFLAVRPAAREDLSIAYYNLGNRYKTLGQWPLAIESYGKSLRRNPNYLSTYNNLALALEASGDRDAEAIAAWEHVRQLGEARGLERYLNRAERHIRALRARSGEQPRSAEAGGESATTDGPPESP